MLKEKSKISQEEHAAEIKYCSDYDEDCHELLSPYKCFMGGDWECENGIKSKVPIADGICKMMDSRR